MCHLFGYQQERKGIEVDKGCILCYEKVKFYTGLSSTQVLQATFNLILPGINQQKTVLQQHFKIYDHVNEYGT